MFNVLIMNSQLLFQVRVDDKMASIALFFLPF